MDSLKCLTSTHLFTLVSLHSSTLIPIFIIGGWSRVCNDIHQWPVIRWWTAMFDLDTSIHIVGHVLVVVCVEYLRDWWNILYATSLIVPVFMRFQLSWPNSSVYQISSSIMEILIIVYCTCWWPHMKFVYHAYSWPLYSYVSRTAICIFVVICRYLSFYCTDEWLVLPPRSSLLHFWDGFYNVFCPSCSTPTPLFTWWVMY